MPRLAGQVFPRIPPTAPLALRLADEVYALDGIPEEALGNTQYTGPAVGPEGRGHSHAYSCGGLGDDYVLPFPGGRLEVGADGKLYETLGASDTAKNPEGITKALIVIGALAVAFFVFSKK